MREGEMLKKTVQMIWYWLARWACRVFCILFFSLRVYGKENVPDKGAFLLVSNHQSYLDPVLCGVALKRHLFFLARESLFANRLFRWLICSLNALPVKPGKADVSAMKKVISKLKEGNGVCLYPEATRTSDGRIRELKPGFGLLCRRAEAAVVPVMIEGAFECWPRHKRILSPGRIELHYGKAITAQQVHDISDRELAEVLTNTLRQIQTKSRVRQGKEPFAY